MSKITVTAAELAATIDRVSRDRLDPDFNRAQRATARYHASLDKMFELAIRDLEQRPDQPSEAETWLIKNGFVD